MPLRHQAEPYQAVPANGAHLRPDGAAALLGPAQGSVRRRCHQSQQTSTQYFSTGTSETSRVVVTTRSGRAAEIPLELGRKRPVGGHGHNQRGSIRHSSISLDPRRANHDRLHDDRLRKSYQTSSLAAVDLACEASTARTGYARRDLRVPIGPHPTGLLLAAIPRRIRQRDACVGQ